MSVIDLGDQRVPVPAAPRFDSDDNWGKQKLLRTDEAKRAAAMAVGNLVADFAANPQTPQQAETAGLILSELSQNLGLSEPQAAAVTPAAAPPPAVLPDEIAELLEDEDDADEIVSVDETDDIVAEDDAAVTDDPEVLKRKLAAAEKKAEHERKLRVQSSRKGWEDEVRRVYQYAGQPLVSDDELAAIQADSKNGFLKEAKQIARAKAKVLQQFNVAAQPVPERREPAHDPQVWGEPTVGDPLAPAGSVRQAERVNAARRTGRLSEGMKAMIFPE